MSAGSEPSTLHIKAESRLEEIERVLQAFEAFWNGRGLTDDVRRRIQMALDELLSNVILYGYDDEGLHVIDVNIEISGSRVILRVADDGRPFDPLARPEPDITLGIEERRIGGLGVHLIENLMDEVSYSRQDNLNVTVLTKDLLNEESEAEQENS